MIPADLIAEWVRRKRAANEGAAATDLAARPITTFEAYSALTWLARESNRLKLIEELTSTAACSHDPEVGTTHRLPDPQPGA